MALDRSTYSCAGVNRLCLCKVNYSPGSAFATEALTRADPLRPGTIVGGRGPYYSMATETT